MPKKLTETAVITEAAAAVAKETGRLPVQFISPGWGSSGYYSSDVLKQAAADRVIPAGTQMYADHPTDTEVMERPVRSVKDLMAVVVEDARVATDEDVRTWGADPGSLVGEVDVVPAWQPLVETVRDSIGTSIRGSATDIVVGEAEGRRGGIIEGLVAPVLSVDFVTRAGRGGKVLRVIESAAANRRAIEHGLAEATVNDIREALQTALREAHATAPDVWLWVRDFDDSTVWFEIEGSGAGDAAGIYGQTYTETDGVIGLTGDRTEVRVVTTYVPVTRPGSTTTTATESEEDTMPKIQIEESEHARLTETAGRVDALQQENATLKAEVTTLKEADARRTREDRARAIVTEKATEGKVQFTDLEVDGLIVKATVTESGDLDETAFGQLVDTQVEARKTATSESASSVHGFGASAAATQVTESGHRTATPWGRPLTEQKGA